jgi:hypothetical protein
MGWWIVGTEHLMERATMEVEAAHVSSPVEVLAHRPDSASAGLHHMQASPEDSKHNHHWFRKWLRGEPHITLGGDDPYMKRWYVIPRNHVFNIYLHQFCRSDEDHALHDHPWNFWSLILRGQYIEHTAAGSLLRKRFSLAYRPAEHAHRVELESEVESFTDDGYYNPWTGDSTFYRKVEKPVWTLFFTSRKRRQWGFHCPKGWVHWEKFTAGPKGERSIGCGEFS